MAVLHRYKRPESNHSLIGMWHIYKMENWDEDYFNIEVQAYIEITPENIGEFQFGLVSSSLDGYLKTSMAKSASLLLGKGMTKWTKPAGVDGYSSAARTRLMVSLNYMEAI
jgi:hypothetical protein